MKARRRGFTLLELLVSMAVLALLMALIAQLFNGAQAVTGLGSKRMDADTQARAVFDRMAIDFAQMVKRPDVDYYLKDLTNTQTGNDQIAFYSQVQGYYPPSGPQSPVSLVAWRVNTNGTSAFFNKLQRLGCGLVWNGVSNTDTPVVFLPLTISANWPAATNMDADANYETAGPQVFRMEYYYVLRGQTSPAGTVFDSQLSDTPWEKRNDTQNADSTLRNQPWHTSVDGLRDVAAIGVVIAVVDPKSLILVTDQQLKDLADKKNMQDFSPTDTPNPGDLETQWQAAINSAAIPRVAASGIRVYSRTFYLPNSSLPNAP